MKDLCRSNSITPCVLNLSRNVYVQRDAQAPFIHMLNVLCSSCTPQCTSGFVNQKEIYGPFPGTAL